MSVSVRDVKFNRGDRWRHKSLSEVVTVLHLLGERGGMLVVFRPGGCDSARSDSRTRFLRNYQRVPEKIA